MTILRVLLDTNVLVSYLLLPLPGRPPSLAIEAALAQAYTLLLPIQLVEELFRAVAAKPYLADRIAASDAQRLIDALAAVAELAPTLREPFSEVGRDRNDDYLLAYCRAYQVDVLVTGDLDLLALAEGEGDTIVRPAKFARLLDERKEP